MHRAILHALTPAFIALAVAFLLLWLVVRLSGAKLRFKRLFELHRCQDGGVQSLAFVVTLPLFIMIVSFIVQVSQLMVGVVVVHYAAFSTTRAASVWIPANVEIDGYYYEPENVLPPPIAEDNPLVLRYLGGDENDSVSGQGYTYKSYKLERIMAAAAMGCAPISPSRDLGFTLNGPAGRTQAAARELYTTLIPSALDDARFPRRVENKVAYSYWNTILKIEFVDKNTRQGPTYNPRQARRVEDPPGSGNFHWERHWNPHEVGWQDPVTVTVTHRLALLPGPGRFLAKYIVRADGEEDEIAPLIDREHRSHNGGYLYRTPISASCTLTNEGLKPVVRYVQRR